MANFSRIKIWTSGEVLYASDLNAEFNNIINNMDPDGVEDASEDVAAMQATADPGGVGSESLATSLRGELQRLRFALKRIVGGAQWYSAPVIDLGSTIGTSDIADSAVTTAKIDNDAVTPAKRSTLNLAISTNSSGSFSTTNTSLTDVTNLTVSITASGNQPVFIGLIADPAESTDGAFIGVSEAIGTFAIMKGVTLIGLYQMNGSDGAVGAQQQNVPASCLWGIDQSPSAGSNTYKIQVKQAIGGSGVAVFRAKLMAYEM